MKVEQKPSIVVTLLVLLCGLALANSATAQIVDAGAVADQTAILHVDVPEGARVTDIKVAREKGKEPEHEDAHELVVIPSSKGVNPTWSRYRHFKIAGLVGKAGQRRCKVEVHVSMLRNSECKCPEKKKATCDCEETTCCKIVYLRPGDEEVLSFSKDQFESENEAPEVSEQVVVFVNSDQQSPAADPAGAATPKNPQKTKGPFRFKWKNDDGFRIECQISFDDNLATTQPKFVPNDIQLGVDPSFKFPNVDEQGKPELSARLWVSSLADDGTETEEFGPIQLGAFPIDWDRQKRSATFKLNEENSLQAKLTNKVVSEITKNIVDQVHDVRARLILEIDGYVMLDGQQYQIGKYLTIEIRTKETAAGAGGAGAGGAGAGGAGAGGAGAGGAGAGGAGAGGAGAGGAGAGGEGAGDQ